MPVQEVTTRVPASDAEADGASASVETVPEPSGRVAALSLSSLQSSSNVFIGSSWSRAGAVPAYGVAGVPAPASGRRAQVSSGSKPRRTRRSVLAVIRAAAVAS